MEVKKEIKSNAVNNLPDFRSRLRAILEQIFLFLVVVFIFWLIFRRVPVEDVLIALKKVKPVRFFSLSFIFVWLALFLDSYTHYFLFNHFGVKIDLKNMFQLRLASMLLGSLGFLYGQGGLSWLVSKHTKAPLTQVVGLLVFLLFNTFFSACLLAGILGGILLVPENNSGFFLKLYPWVLASWLLFALAIGFWKSRLKNYLPKRLREGLFYGFDRAPLIRYFQLAGLRALMFSLIASFVWMAMPALEFHLPFSVVYSLIPIQGIIIAFPTPGRYGINEGGYLLLFRNWADESQLVAFALLWGTSANILRAIFSLLALRRYRER